MRILFVTDLYPLKKDKTIPNAIKNFVLSFKKRGHNVAVLRGNFLLNSIIRGHKITKQNVYFEDGIKIYNRNFLLPFLNSDIRFLKEKYDLIISHMPSGNIYASSINKKLELPHISIVHQSDYRVLSDIKYSFYFKNRLKNALINSTLVGARNHFLYEKLNADFILPSFIEEKNILKEKKVINNEKMNIITLSKLIKRKNIDLVIKALSSLDFDYQYSIYGDGREKNNLQKMIKKYNLQDKIKIYPYINHELIYQKLDENDVFILPSVDETFGIAYLEAMSRGLVTVGVKNTGIDGFIEDNKNGYLVEPNVFEVKNVLVKINSKIQDKIIKNTLENIKKYSENEIMNKYDETIKKVLEK